MSSTEKPEPNEHPFRDLMVSKRETDKGEWKKFQRELEKAYPALWAKCCPRKYDDYKVNEYPSPKEVSYQLLMNLQRGSLGYNGQSETYELMWVNQQIRYRVPIYWIQSDLGTAIMKTVPPQQLDWLKIPVPMRAMSFLLPKGLLTHEKEGNINFVSFFQIDAGETIPSYLEHGPHQYYSENGCMTLFAVSEAGYLTHWNIPHEAYKGVISFPEFMKLMNKHSGIAHNSTWSPNLSLTDADTKLGLDVAHLIFGTLLLIARKPEYLAKGAMLKRVKGGRGEVDRELWSPHVIGRNYKIKSIPGPSLGGTHASPREHWVTGHWKDVYFGTGKSNVRDQWIQPYWRGDPAHLPSLGS